ncbi:putative IS1 encoded domain protein [Escherichia coli 1-176-05_S3_C2]|nr:putative IS1 encoded domain protein [Escherichia coli 1-176-05_S3_C2]
MKFIFYVNIIAPFFSLLPAYREISAQKHKKFLHLPLDDVGYDPI